MGDSTNEMVRVGDGPSAVKNFILLCLLLDHLCMRFMLSLLNVVVSCIPCFHPNVLVSSLFLIVSIHMNLPGFSLYSMCVSFPYRA